MFVFFVVPDLFPVIRRHAHERHVVSRSIFLHTGLLLLHDLTAADLVELDHSLIQSKHITVYRIFPKIQNA